MDWRKRSKVVCELVCRTPSLFYSVRFFVFLLSKRGIRLSCHCLSVNYWRCRSAVIVQKHDMASAMAVESSWLVYQWIGHVGTTPMKLPKLLLSLLFESNGETGIDEDPEFPLQSYSSSDEVASASDSNCDSDSDTHLQACEAMIKRENWTFIKTIHSERNRTVLSFLRSAPYLISHVLVKWS